MELVAAFSSGEMAKQAAQTVGGWLVIDPRPDTSHLPFAALVAVSGDTVEPLQSADIGLYVCYRREQKLDPNRTPAASGQLPGRIALFPMVRHQALSHRASDDHWRDVHTPIALRVHQAMTFYTQLSITAVIRGPQWDGFALCGFGSEHDLRHRFYATPEGQKEVERDVTTFANPKASPRRLVCDEYNFRER